ncbi:hypothetical protein [Streptomyces sp. NPDC058382]|uniref:hypothetical protein n=1 Tax=unclassified Streptomyces TaxID=2593676 RepID=UPI00363D913C
MADEQYAWLDKEAAERLLRREPVDPADGQPGQDAERLAAALDEAARTARPATGELPGEAAALAAFRAAPRTSSVSRRAGRAPAAGTDKAGETGVLAPVHIGRAVSGHRSGAAGPRGARQMRWSRPIRFGLVASLACCAIGGVAVAAGTGVLPAPFGRHTPSPSTSVSAAASPEELGSGLTTDDGTPAPPSGSPDATSPPPSTAHPADPDREDTTGPGTTPTGPGAGSGRGSGETEGPAEGSSRSGSGDGTGGGAGKPDPSQDDTSEAWYARTLKACRDYRDGKLDDDRRRRLEALAKGAHNLDQFCERMLDKAGDGNSDGHNGDDGGESDGDGAPSGGSGSLPSIGFSNVSPEPTAAFAGSGRADEGATSQPTKAPVAAR